MQRLLAIRALGLLGCVAPASCHWVFPYESGVPGQDLSAHEASLADRSSSDGRSGEARADVWKTDVLPQCSESCDSVTEVCCDKGSGPACSATAAGCRCDPGSGAPCSSTIDAPICCDTGTGAGPRCSSLAAATTCTCDPVSGTPCRDTAATVCCDKGSGFKCAQNAMGCACDPGTNQPCKGDTAAPLCCAKTLKCAGFCP